MTHVSETSTLSDTVAEVARFFEREWGETVELLHDPDVVFHETRVETDLDPVGLETLLVEYMHKAGRTVINIGHAVYEDVLWIKMYPVEPPVLNLVIRYAPGAGLRVHEDEPYATWTRSAVDRYLNDFPTKLPTEADLAAVDEYFASAHWREHMLDQVADPEVEHFHLYLNTELNPLSLEYRFRDALTRAGHVVNVAPFFLARADNQSLWVGHAPPGRTSWEITMYYSPGVTIEGKEMTDEERAYGGEGWTVADHKAFLERTPFKPFTPAEVREALSRVPMLSAS